jgi:hypothetical protein
MASRLKRLTLAIIMLQKKKKVNKKSIYKKRFSSNAAGESTSD